MMVYRLVLVSFIMCFLAQGKEYSFDLKSCLQPVSEEKDPETKHFLLISMDPLTPAREGDYVINGDRVIGFDGFRVSTLSEYHLVQWCGIMHNAPLRLRVIRNGEFKDLVIHGFLPGRKLGIVLWPNKLLRHTLRENGVDLAAILKQKLGGTIQHRELEFPSILPGACQRAISRLIARGNTDREWALEFLDVYLDMLVEDYDKARPGINTLLRSSNEIDPLLISVLEFYDKVAQKQPDAEMFPLAFYGVTKEFAAVYYPYPYYRFPKIGNVFPDDPAYQKVLETVLYGTSAEVASASQDLSWAPEFPEGRNAHIMCERYMYDVKRSFMNPERKYHLPHKSYLVQNSRKRKIFLQMLRSRFDEKPDDRFITSIGLVMAGLYEGSANDVKKGQEHIATLGPTENALLTMAVSTATNCRTHGTSTRYRETLREFLDSQNKALEIRMKIPGVYRYLYNHVPVFHSVGLSDFLEFEYISGLNDHYSKQPELVAPALVSEFNCTEMWKAIQAGKSSEDLTDVKQAFRYATMRLAAGRSWKTEVQDFLELARKLPISEHYRSCIEILSALQMRRGLWGKTYVDFMTIVAELKAREEQDLREHLQVIESWDNKSPALVSMAADYFDKHGSPLVTLALYRKLHDAGKQEEALQYKGYATNLASGTLKIFGDKRLDFWDNISLNYMLASDLAGFPGMEEATLEFFHPNRLGGEPFASTVTMHALALGNLGQWDAAVYKLERAFGMPTTRAKIMPPNKHKKRNHVIWYNGKALSSGTHDFPLTVAQDWLKSPKVTDEHKRRIETAVSKWQTLDIEGRIPAEGRELIAVPSKGKIVIDGRLDDWDLSGKRSVGDDMRYRSVCSAEVALSYDEKGLYGAIHFNDARPMDNPFSRVSNYGDAGDSAVFCFRIGNKSSTVASWYSATTRRNGPVIYHQVGDDPISPEKGRYKRHHHDRSDFEGFEVAFVPDANGEGYTQEIFIPWEKISNGRGIPKEEIHMALELNWGYGYTAWFMMANLREGVNRHNNVRKNTDNYGVLRLSPQGNLKLPVESWRDAMASWETKLNAQKSILHTVIPPTNARFSRLASAGPNLVAIDAQQALTIWPTAVPAISDKGTTVKLNKGRITAIAGNADGSLIAVGGHDGKIYLLSDTGEIKSESKPCDKAIQLITFSPKGAVLAVAGADHKLVTYKMPAIDKPIQTIQLSKSISALEFISDSELYIGLHNGTMEVIDLTSGKSRMLNHKHKFAIRGLSASLDGKLLFSISDDLAIGVWDPVKGVISKVFTAQNSLPRGLLAHADGKLISVGLDGSLVISDASEGIVIASTVLEDDGIVGLTRFGKGRFAALGRNGKIFIVDPTHMIQASKEPADD